MPLSEANTRAKLIDPALHACGWTEDLIRREETAGAVEIVDGRPRKRWHGRMDYTLRVADLISELTEPYKRAVERGMDKKAIDQVQAWVTQMACKHDLPRMAPEP